MITFDNPGWPPPVNPLILLPAPAWADRVPSKLPKSVASPVVDIVIKSTTFE